MIILLSMVMLVLFIAATEKYVMPIAANICLTEAKERSNYIINSAAENVLNERGILTEDPDFKGYIHDVGGPTANFRHPSCEKQMTKGVCKTKQCLFPTPCKNLNADHKDYVALLRKLRKVPKVKKVFIRSGIRFD